MSATVNPATLILSIDVNLVGWNQTATVEAAAHAVLDRLHAAKVVATWGLTDPGHDIASLVTQDSSHEVALLADATLVGSHLPRAHFSREMALRLKRARAAGVAPSTMLLADGCRVGHVDLLVKLGTTAVRSAPVQGVAGSIWQQLLSVGRRPHIATQPQWLRWGVRELPGALSLTGNSWGFLRRVADGACAEGRLVQWTLDLAQVAAAPRVTLATLDVLLKHVERRQREGVLRSATADQLIARLSQPRTTRHSRSILQRQAA